MKERWCFCPDGSPSDPSNAYSDEVQLLVSTGVTPRAFGVGTTANMAALRIIDDTAQMFTDTDGLTNALTNLGVTSDDEVVFQVKLTKPHANAVEVDYFTADGTAVGGADYVSTSGTLVFDPGEMARTVTVDMIDDMEQEGDEVFYLRVNNPVEAIVTDGEGEGLIIDNEVQNSTESLSRLVTPRDIQPQYIPLPPSQQMIEDITRTISPDNYVPGHLLVTFDSDMLLLADQEELVASLGGEIVHKLVFLDAALVRLNAPSEHIVDDVETWGSNPAFLSVSPDFYQSLSSTTPQDPLFSSQWGLHNDGSIPGKLVWPSLIDHTSPDHSTPGHPNQHPPITLPHTANPAEIDADIDAIEAWDLQRGSSEVIVAVIDSGIDFEHEDLKDNMWINHAEAQGQPGVDDDGNWYIDDIHGWDWGPWYGDGEYTNPTAPPQDETGHGTHVAGIIGANGNNQIGVAGINWDVSLMALSANVGNYFPPSQEEPEDGSSFIPYSAVTFALDYVGVRKFYYGDNIPVVNMSLGGPSLYQCGLPLEDDPFEPGTPFWDLYWQGYLIGALGSIDTLVVAAAGNGTNDFTCHKAFPNDPRWAFSQLLGDDNDNYIHNYPSDYTWDNIISVAASDVTDQLAPFSNYGAVSVDLAAPGGDGYLTLGEKLLQEFGLQHHSERQIQSTWPTELGDRTGYNSIAGTSMAAPMVAGAVALMKATQSSGDGSRNQASDHGHCRQEAVACRQAGVWRPPQSVRGDQGNCSFVGAAGHRSPFTGADTTTK